MQRLGRSRRKGQNRALVHPGDGDQSALHHSGRQRPQASQHEIDAGRFEQMVADLIDRTKDSVSKR
jgi:hypothetical protein